MNKPNDFDNVQAFGEYTPLPAGGYVCRIMGVEETVSSNGKAMIIIPHQTGYTRLSFCKGKKLINLLVKVSENETCIKHVNGIKLIPIDLPPELK